MRYWGFAIAVLIIFAGADPAAAMTELEARQQLKTLSPEAYKKQVENTDFKAHTVNADKFLELMNDPKTVILDLRDETAYHRGHIRGAKQLGADIKANKLEKLAPDKTATVLLYCTNSLYLVRQISETNVALPQMLALGYPNTYFLEDAARDTTRSGNIDRTDKLPMVIDASPTSGGAAANPMTEKDAE